MTLVREVGQVKAAMVLGDPWRLETVSRLFGSDGLPLPLPPQEYVMSVVRAQRLLKRKPCASHLISRIPSTCWTKTAAHDDRMFASLS